MKLLLEKFFETSYNDGTGGWQIFNGELVTEESWRESVKIPLPRNTFLDESYQETVRVDAYIKGRDEGRHIKDSISDPVIYGRIACGLSIGAEEASGSKFTATAYLLGLLEAGSQLLGHIDFHEGIAV